MEAANEDKYPMLKKLVKIEKIEKIDD